MHVRPIAASRLAPRNPERVVAFLRQLPPFVRISGIRRCSLPFLFLIEKGRFWIFFSNYFVTGDPGRIQVKLHSLLPYWGRLDLSLQSQSRGKSQSRRQFCFWHKEFHTFPEKILRGRSPGATHSCRGSLLDDEPRPLMPQGPDVIFSYFRFLFSLAATSTSDKYEPRLLRLHGVGEGLVPLW